MAEILAAEDDRNIRDVLRRALKAAGYSVRLANDGAAAMEAFADRRPDLVILDVMMPHKSGFEACSEIRRSDPAVPVIMLTAKGTEEDKVLGLGLGADDYIVKPFGVKELVARVATALRRAQIAPQPGAVPPKARIPFGATHFVDQKRMSLVSKSGEETPLTLRELALLKFFAAHPGEVLSRDELLDAVWGIGYFGNTRTLDQYVMRLRKKLGKDGTSLEAIVRMGYRYRSPEKALRK